jgi:hypothetical protein
MTTFAQAVNTPSMTTTTNGMAAFDKTGNKVLDLFYNIGSSRNNPAIVQTFMTAFGEDPLLTMKCLFWARDVRQGAGERKVFRDILSTLEMVNPSAVVKNLHLVPEFGRFDDLLVFHVPAVRRVALKVFTDAIQSGNGLACKWAPRKGADAEALRKTMMMSPKQYRQTIVAGSKTVEQQMCAQKWTDIEYGQIPSIAAARYQTAFARHDFDGYTAYKEALKSGDAKVNASVLYPHDVIRSLEGGGDGDVAQAQWTALPNYVGDKRVLPISDVSGSMDCKASGSITCMDVSVALGLYLAEKNTSVFQNLICTFHTTPELFEVKGSIAEKYLLLKRAPWGGSTNFEATFNLILKKAKENNVPQEEMPEVIVCLSDMQFNCATRGYSREDSYNPTAMEMIKQKYATAGYKVPMLVFWNLNAVYGNAPSTAQENGVVLISGFSPAIMKAVLAGDFDSISPYKMMLDVLNSTRYEGVQV